jgi:hypothetical protein
MQHIIGISVALMLIVGIKNENMGVKMEKPKRYFWFLVIGLLSFAPSAQGAGWINMLPTYNTSGLCVNRLNGDIYVNLSGKGIWKSTDKGAHFALVDGNVTGFNESPWSVNQDESNPARIALFCDYGSAGITTDGTNWHALNALNADGAFGSVDWSTPNAKTMIMVTHGGGTIAITSNAGVNWRTLGFSMQGIGDAERDTCGMIGALDGKTFIYSMLASGIMRSVDTGKTWTKVSDEIVLTRTPRILNGKIYLGGANGLVVSTDNGATWQKQGSPVHIWQGPFFASTVDTMVIAGNDGVFKSTDNGATWNKISDLYAAWPDKTFYKVHPGWFMNYAWDPVHNVIFASCPRNYAFKKELSSATAVEKKTIAVSALPLLASPNPFSGATELSFPNPLRNAEVRLYAIDGKVVLEIKGVSSDRIRISGRSLAPGVYTAEVRTAGKSLKTPLCLTR